MAYNEDEKLSALRKSFLTPPVYAKIYERFRNKELPKSMLDKVLIREFEVSSDIALRVANYFISGAVYTQLLVNNRLLDLADDKEEIIEQEENNSKTETQNDNEIINAKKYFEGDETLLVEKNFDFNHNNQYTIHIYGPGINSKLTVNDDDDFFIVEATLNKLKKKLKEGGVIKTQNGGK